MKRRRKRLTAKFSGGKSGMQLLRITGKTEGDKEASWEVSNPADGGSQQTGEFLFKSRFISWNISKIKSNVTNYVAQGRDLRFIPAAGIFKR